jgi:HEXXH motif-containing protein
MEVVGAEDADIDVSYSHPDLSATIFFSVCRDNSAVSRLRVAESILHETMHLKLSLIERMIPVVISGAGGRFFSPWREELRPAQGIVHGIFVFRTLLEFFREAEGRVKDREAVGHARDRQLKINEELSSLTGFERCPDLTPAGASLIASLLPSS